MNITPNDTSVCLKEKERRNVLSLAASEYRLCTFRVSFNEVCTKFQVHSGKVLTVSSTVVLIKLVQ